MTGIWYCDTEDEKFEHIEELEQNPDFTYLGHFDTVQDIYYELNEQGFTDVQIDEMSLNRYGRCLEIIEYVSYYDAFIGER